MWVHYAAAKVARGELFEALDFMAFLRGQVLGPLALMEKVRSTERRAPDSRGMRRPAPGRCRRQWRATTPATS